MRSHFEKPFFRRLFSFCFLILCGFSFLFSFAFLRQYRQDAENLEKQEIRNRIQMITRDVDDKFSEMDRVGAQLSISSLIAKASSSQELISSDVDLFRRREICQQIGTYDALIRVAKSTALLIPGRGIVVDGVSFWEQERYFASVRLPAKKTEGAISTALSGNFNSLALMDLKNVVKADTTDFLVLKKLNYADPARQVLFYYVDGRAFEENVLRNWSKVLTEFEIEQKGKTVYRCGDTSGASGAGLYTAAGGSELYPWSYRFSLIRSGAGAFGEAAVFALSLISLLLGSLVLSYLLARLLYRPLFRLQQKLDLGRLIGGETEFEAIERSFSSLRQEKTNFERLSASYYNTVQSNLLNRLLQGLFERDAGTAELGRFGLPLSNEMQFLTAVLDYPEPDDKDKRAYDYLLLSEWGKKEGFRTYLTETPDRKLVLIMEAESADALIEQANEYKSFYRRSSNSGADFLCGLPYKGLIGVSKSYFTARERAPSPRLQQQERVYYPIDWEVQLINQLRLNKEEVALRILDELKKENLGRRLSAEENRRAVSLVMETLLRVGSDMGMETAPVRSEFRSVLMSEGTGWPWDYMANFIHLVCRRSALDSAEAAKETERALVAYVDGHYCDPNLSQQELADIFHISRSMVSKIFKKTAKINFLDYLHLLRVQKAKQLFEEGETDVMKVAEKTGYGNEITFKRAFLRVESVTPRKYLQKLKDSVAK